jgi:pimeloyl-ACP methyl ester carboxylesterase
MAHPERLPGQLLEIATATTRRKARAWRDFAARIVARRSVGPDLQSKTWLADRIVPADFTVGDRDPFGGVDGIKQLAVGNAGPTIIPDAGHLPWLDEPDLTTQAILTGLAERPTPSRRLPPVPDRPGSR